MQGHSGFFKTSSVVVKTAAWIFFFFGLIGAVSMLLGAGGLEYPRWMGFIILPIYTFISFCLYLLAEVSKSLAKVIEEEKKI